MPRRSPERHRRGVVKSYQRGRTKHEYRKKLAIGVALAVALMAGTASAKDIKIGLVVKSLGNGFFDAANKGARKPPRSSAAWR